MAAIADTAVTVVARSPGYWSGVAARFLRDPLAVAAALVILIIVLLEIGRAHV